LALGEILASGFFRSIPTLVTTNFDPMLEISLARSGVQTIPVDLTGNGDLNAVVGDRLQVFHVHGYWRSAGGASRRRLFHVPEQISASRDLLSHALSDRIRSDAVLVCGYGGWDDVIAAALDSVNTGSELEVLWCQYSDDVEAARKTRKQISQGADVSLSSVTVFQAVDSNLLFQGLKARLIRAESRSPASSPPRRRPRYVSLNSPAVEAKIFGSKAANLSTLARYMAIPEGYALYLGSYDGQLSASQVAKVNDLWERATGDSNGETKWIVRSSASSEDGQDAAFAGRFASVAGVSDYEGFVDAVKVCMQSLHSPRVSEYAQAMEVAENPAHMALILQREIFQVAAGVAFSPPPPPFDDDPNALFLVEMTLGAATKMLGGEGGTVYRCFRDGYVLDEHIAGPRLEDGLAYQIISALKPAMTQIHSLIPETQVTPAPGSMLDVEWVWDGLGLSIVQARRLPRNVSPPTVTRVAPGPASVRPTLRLPEADLLGSKGAAAKMFSELGIGARNATLILPGTSDEVAQRELERRPEGYNGTVIRFSVGSEVGVPKRFVDRGGSLVDAFLDARDELEDPTLGTGIVSDFVFVRSSFEAYMSSDSLVVEHVPGNWEADSALPLTSSSGLRLTSRSTG
jgi:hypothetical protein